MNTEILLVDDDEMTLFIHEKILDRCSMKHPYKSFTSGESCLGYMLRDENQDKKFIILLDINMPFMSGWDFLERLAGEGFSAERGIVVMATSSVDFEDRQKASTYKSVVDFFEKPLTLSTCESLSRLPEIAAF
jgi:CheY-like chemotaxis protein